MDIMLELQENIRGEKFLSYWIYVLRYLHISH